MFLSTVIFLYFLGILDYDCDIGITAEEYSKNLFMIPFDLSPRGDNGLQPHCTQEGDLSFIAGLRTPLTHPLTVMIYAVFENSIEVI